jgi:hypothetical protein
MFLSLPTRIRDIMQVHLVKLRSPLLTAQTTREVAAFNKQQTIRLDSSAHHHVQGRLSHLRKGINLASCFLRLAPRRDRRVLLSHLPCNFHFLKNNVSEEAALKQPRHAGKASDALHLPSKSATRDRMRVRYQRSPRQMPNRHSTS